MPPIKKTKCEVNNSDCRVGDGYIRRGMCNVHYRRYMRTGVTGRSPSKSHLIATTGKARCSVCGKNLPVSEFSPRKNSASGIASWCRLCFSKYYRERRKNNPPAPMPIEERRRRNLTRYGLTPKQFNAMYKRQGGTCAICGGKETRINPRTGDTYLLHVDHDHKTGEVRGLLCSRCNSGLGYFRDTPDLLLSATAYLRNPPARKKLLKRKKSSRLGRESAG